MVWMLEPDDEIVVGGHPFQVKDLATIELIDVPWRVSNGTAQVWTERGYEPVETTAVRWKDEQPTDLPEGMEPLPGNSGIEVIWPLSPLSVPLVVDALTAKQVRVARSLPAEASSAAQS